jgi:hypothetical protein
VAVVKRRAVILTARCVDIGETEAIEINPAFVEYDISINAVRYICSSCGDVHTRQGPDEDPRQIARDFRAAGARVFNGLKGDIALARKD